MSSCVKRKLKTGKSKKKSWKSININYVEDYLKDQRLQERLGYVKFIMSTNC